MSYCSRQLTDHCTHARCMDMGCMLNHLFLHFSIFYGLITLLPVHNICLVFVHIIYEYWYYTYYISFVHYCEVVLTLLLEIGNTIPCNVPLDLDLLIRVHYSSTLLLYDYYVSVIYISDRIDKVYVTVVFDVNYWRNTLFISLFLSREFPDRISSITRCRPWTLDVVFLHASSDGRKMVVRWLMSQMNSLSVGGSPPSSLSPSSCWYCEIKLTVLDMFTIATMSDCLIAAKNVMDNCVYSGTYHRLCNTSSQGACRSSLIMCIGPTTNDKCLFVLNYLNHPFSMIQKQIKGNQTGQWYQK